MFDQIMGLPMHVLLVHAAVVFVPLLATAAVVYALVPRLRGRVGWVAVLLSVAAPVASLLSTLSGEAFKDRLVARGVPADFLAPILEHEGYGDLTLWFSIGLGVSTAALVFVTQRRGRERSLPIWMDLGLTIVTVVLAAASVYFVIRTGDSGAKAVWSE